MSNTSDKANTEVAVPTKAERQVRSAARLQRRATGGGVRSSASARKALMAAVKERGYSIELMDKLWDQAIAIAKDAGKKTVQEKDVQRVLGVVDAVSAN